MDCSREKWHSLPPESGDADWALSHDPTAVTNVFQKKDKFFPDMQKLEEIFILLLFGSQLEGN